MKLSDVGVELLKSFEGLSLKPYLCAAGRWTIGYGHTGDVTENTQRINEHQAEAILRLDMDWAEEAVERWTQGVKLSQPEFDALVSLTFNIGETNFANSTLRKLLLRGAPRVDVAEQFLVWRKAAGKVNQGLVNRRTAERELFLKQPVIVVSRNRNVA